MNKFLIIYFFQKKPTQVLWRPELQKLETIFFNFITRHSYQTKSVENITRNISRHQKAEKGANLKILF